MKRADPPARQRSVSAPELATPRVWPEMSQPSRPGYPRVRGRFSENRPWFWMIREERAMSFRGVFIAVVLSAALIVSAFILQSRRPRIEINRQSAALVMATGKCADCHRHETSAVVHEYEMSRHSAVGVNCLDCHQPSKGKEPMDHKGFTISRKLSAANCLGCHPDQYQQFLQSRHAAPAWAAVTGKQDFSAEQIAFAEKIDKGAVDR